MFRLAYITAARLAKLFLPLAGQINEKVNFFVNQRKNAKGLSPKARKYWIHCASLGEYEMAIPLIENILLKHTKKEILITFFSPSGYTQAIKGAFSDLIMYIPLDDLALVKQFYNQYKPQIAIFIRYDLWYNFIFEGQKRDVKFYLINARFGAHHFIFKPFGKPYYNLLKNFRGVYTSDADSQRLLVSKGISAFLAGDTRYDRVSDIAKKANLNVPIANFVGGRKILLVGSSWQPEEDLIAQLLLCELKNLAIIIAPHDVKRSNGIVQQLKDYLPKKYTNGDFGNEDSILVLDTMGMLSSLYQYADFALVGGGFSGALHNILEPAVWGCRIFFGPKVEKFPEAQDFIDSGFASIINENELFINEIIRLLDDEKELNSIKLKTKAYTKSKIGATFRIIKNLA